jgi:hypothetical protein
MCDVPTSLKSVREKHLFICAPAFQNIGCAQESSANDRLHHLDRPNAHDLYRAVYFAMSDSEQSGPYICAGRDPGPASPCQTSAKDAPELRFAMTSQH